MPAIAGNEQDLPVPEVEKLELLRDDLENGRFDAFVPAPGTGGTFAVVNDGAGNQVARLGEGMRLELHQYLYDARQEPTTWEDYEVSVRARRSPEGEIGFGVRALRGTGYWLSNVGNVWTLQRQRPAELTDLASIDFQTPVESWFDLQIIVRTSETGAQIDAILDAEPLISFIDNDDPIATGALEFRAGAGAELSLDDLVVTGETDSRYSWTETGGPPGGWLSDVAVSPDNWRTAYLGSGDGGLFKTVDGGMSWEEVSLSRGQWKVRIRNVEVAPSDPEVVYVTTDGKGVSPLWRSEDGAQTWRWTSAGDIDDYRHAWTDVYALAIDPTDPMHIFVGLGDDGVYESPDGGDTLVLLETGGGDMRALAVDPSDADRVLSAPVRPASEPDSVLRSIDGGDTWKPSGYGLDGRAVRQLHFYAPEPSVVFAVADGLLYRSIDGGQMWDLLETGSFGLSAVFAVRSSANPVRVVAAGGSGVFVSNDQGDSWTPVAGSAPPAIIAADVGTDDPDVFYAASEAFGIWVSTDAGETWRSSHTGLNAQPIASLAVDPTNRAVIFAGGIDGLYRSGNFGRTWSKILSPGPFQGMATALAVDPRNRRILYVGLGTEGGGGTILKSTDGGSTWVDITGIVGYSVSTFVFDPDDSSILYAGTGGGPQSGPDGAGLYRSRDGGAKWEKLPIPEVSVPSVVVDPTDGDHVVVGTMGHGVYVSFNGGDTFEPRTNGFDGTAVSRMIYALAMSPDDPDLIYAGTHSFYGDIGKTSPDNALYATTDGGSNWVPILRDSVTNFGGGVDTIAVVPGHTDWVYVGLHDPGILFTEDGGKEWHFANYGIIPLLTHVYPYRFAFSADGSTLYSGGCGRGIFSNSLFDRRDGQALIPYG